MLDDEAIDNYIVWQLCKQQGIQREIIGSSPDEEKLKQMIEEVRSSYSAKNLDMDDKIDKLKELDSNPDYRSRIFEGCSWKKKTVAIEDLGTTLPRFGDLPPEVISGSLSDVVEFVENADPEQYPSVKYIMSLKEVPEVLNQFYPWVIHPGNRVSKQERMKDVHGDEDWDIEDTWGIINDGNHRAVAKILADKSQELECYIGYRQE